MALEPCHLLLVDLSAGSPTPDEFHYPSSAQVTASRMDSYQLPPSSSSEYERLAPELQLQVEDLFKR